jgi:hypothetical protein
MGAVQETMLTLAADSKSLQTAASLLEYQPDQRVCLPKAASTSR